MEMKFRIKPSKLEIKMLDFKLFIINHSKSSVYTNEDIFYEQLDIYLEYFFYVLDEFFHPSSKCNNCIF